MIKFATTFAALGLLFTSLTAVAQAQSAGSSDTTGTWYFNIKLDGPPACQCIQIARFNPDGTIYGPANDHLSGDVTGIWSQTGYHSISASVVQNNINPDGTAGGIYIIKFTQAIGSGGQASGSGTIQLLDNTGAVQFSGTYTFKATKLTLP